MEGEPRSCGHHLQRVRLALRRHRRIRVFVTWTGYDAANRNMQLEASQALDIFSASDAFVEPIRTKVRACVIDYIESVRNDELPRMASEHMALYTMPSLRHLDQLLSAPDFHVVRNTELYATSLRRLDDLKDYRRLRIFSGRNDVPSLIWLVLLLGGVIMIANTYFFAMRRVRVQALLIATLNITLTLVLFLIFVLNHPFTGMSRASDEPLRQVLEVMKEKLAEEPAPR